MHSLGIGDVIVLSGFINELKIRNKKVTVIAERKIMFMFDSLIHVDEFIEFNPRSFSVFKNKIKHKKYDLIVDFSEMDVTIIRRLRSVLVINHEYSLSYNQPRKTVFDMNIIDEENKHISERMIYVLKLLNIHIKYYKYVLNIKENVNKQVDVFLNEIIN